MLQATGATEYQVWLSDSLENNYRYKIDPTYKISRQSQPKPKWYWSIKEFLKKEWNATVTEGQEADDALGIGLTELGDKSIICSYDKDLLQVPGHHYRFPTREFHEILPLEGLKNFYSQFLIGDRVDDIQGVYGLGPKKTKALLGGCTTEQELFNKVRARYNDDKRLLKNGQLLWVRRKENEIWTFPEQDETFVQDESGEFGDLVD
jgi:5'-3' exonuclease